MSRTKTAIIIHLGIACVPLRKFFYTAIKRQNVTIKVIFMP